MFLFSEEKHIFSEDKYVIPVMVEIQDLFSGKNIPN